MITAVVVTHNSASTVVTCVEALLNSEKVSEIIVVDNASIDETITVLKPCQKVRVLLLDANYGYAVACNRGAKLARQDWLVFVNPDCFVTADTFSQLLSRIHKAANLGIVGADVRNARGDVELAARRQIPTLSRAIKQWLWAGKIKYGAYYIQPNDEPLHEVDACSGALMLLPRQLYERVGGYDECYRLHVEDLDLCRRIQHLGYRIVVAEGVVVTHIKGTSSLRRPFFVAFQKHKGLARYWFRWGAGAGGKFTAWIAVVLSWLAFLCSLPVLVFQALKKKNFQRK
jgi:N-acetylglucosaminyl-diphospho-decaprenol L-rhamnosyltransferase